MNCSSLSPPLVPSDGEILHFMPLPFAGGWDSPDSYHDPFLGSQLYCHILKASVYPQHGYQQYSSLHLASPMHYLAKTAYLSFTGHASHGRFNAVF